MIAVVATLAITNLLVPPLMADVVVIRASGPSAARYKPGSTLPDATKLVLRPGDHIVLLDAHGTRTVSGPGSFPAIGSGSGSSSALIALAASAGDRRNRIGAVRNLPTGGPSIRPNIFLVDVAAPGAVCIADPAAVTLWRATADVPASSTIAAPDGRATTIRWIKGQSTQGWPAALPVMTGAEYRVADTGTGTAPPVRITFQLLATPPADLPQLAKALIAHGCAAQVDVVVATTGAAAS